MNTTDQQPSALAPAPCSARMTLMRGRPEEIERDLAAIDARIAELTRKLMLARKGLLWIQVRAACDAGDPLADKLAHVASETLAETADDALPS